MMVDGAMLLVDASEGPLPQTRFVLKKALEAGLPIIVRDQQDRPQGRPPGRGAGRDLRPLHRPGRHRGADRFPGALRRSAARAWPQKPGGAGQGPDPALRHHPASMFPPPAYDPADPFQMLVADLDYSDYLGRLAIGRVFDGSAHCNENLVCLNEDGSPRPLRITKLQVYDGINLSRGGIGRAGRHRHPGRHRGRRDRRHHLHPRIPRPCRGSRWTSRPSR